MRTPPVLMGGSNERLKYYLTNQSGRFSPEAVLSLSTVYTTPRGTSTRTDAFLSIVRQTSLLHPSRSSKSYTYTCICLVGHYGEYSFYSSFSFLAAAISSPCILRVPRLRPPASRLHLLYTIYPDNQGPNRDPPLEVQRQRSYTGPYAIPPFLADKKYHSFELQELLDDLNDIMDTSFPLSPSLYFHLIACMSRDYDLGLAHSYLRPHWFSDFATLQSEDGEGGIRGRSSAPRCA